MSGSLEGDEGDARGARGLGGVGLAGHMGLGGRSAWLGCRPRLGLVLLSLSLLHSLEERRRKEKKDREKKKGEGLVKEFEQEVKFLGLTQNVLIQEIRNDQD